MWVCVWCMFHRVAMCFLCNVHVEEDVNSDWSVALFIGAFQETITSAATTTQSMANFSICITSHHQAAHIFTSSDFESISAISLSQYETKWTAWIHFFFSFDFVFYFSRYQFNGENKKQSIFQLKHICKYRRFIRKLWSFSWKICFFFTSFQFRG